MTPTNTIHTIQEHLATELSIQTLYDEIKSLVFGFTSDPNGTTTYGLVDAKPTALAQAISLLDNELDARDAALKAIEQRIKDEKTRQEGYRENLEFFAERVLNHNEAKKIDGMIPGAQIAWVSNPPSLYNVPEVGEAVAAGPGDPLFEELNALGVINTKVTYALDKTKIKRIIQDNDDKEKAEALARYFSVAAESRIRIK